MSSGSALGRVKDNSSNRADYGVRPGIKILLVDDNASNLDIVRRLLEIVGADVVAARDGIEAVEAVARHTDLDIVFLDLNMPRMNGYDAACEIRQTLKRIDLPIIGMTGALMPAEKARATAAGVDDFLGKPFPLRRMVTVLRQWVTS